MASFDHPETRRLQTLQHAEPQAALSASTDSGSLTVSVVWASPDQVSSKSLVVPVGTRVGQALELSGLLQKYQPAGLAVFGQRCDLTRILTDGDRIELCRPLVVEPKAARRRRALHREKVRNIKKKMPIDDLTV
jgi:putative ubiquitin-RnfH superfamily antitoxin RatB of RatAB toxin-antitoxin module